MNVIHLNAQNLVFLDYSEITPCTVNETDSLKWHSHFVKISINATWGPCIVNEITYPFETYVNGATENQMCTYCDTHKCSGLLTLSETAADIYCENNICDDDTCCEPWEGVTLAAVESSTTDLKSQLYAIQAKTNEIRALAQDREILVAVAKADRDAFDCGSVARGCTGEPDCSDLVDICKDEKLNAYNVWENAKKSHKAEQTAKEDERLSMAAIAQDLIDKMTSEDMFIPDFSETVEDHMAVTSMSQWAKIGLIKPELGNKVDIYKCARKFDDLVGECTTCWSDDNTDRTFKEFGGTIARSDNSVDECKVSCYT